jgi:DNA-binding NtrC family response regulator
MVLIIEDEKVSRKALAMLLARQGYESEAVESAEEALTVLNRGSKPDIALIDVDLPGMSGAEFLEKLVERDPGVQPVFITAADEDRLAKLLHHHKIPHLRKPIDFRRLLEFLEQASTINPQQN